ncbi:hypothetical protein ACMAUO_18810 [Gluconacetobacter sp. Hr-1-5]|uniref:hypothetical protein n=1 Tax=Gluconacetobacter sp. Hr-1-5 TaxID=3395370 RepID=UPI003B522C3E
MLFTREGVQFVMNNNGSFLSDSASRATLPRDLEAPGDINGLPFQEIIGCICVLLVVPDYIIESALPAIQIPSYFYFSINESDI